ncbi:unnamed protein product [Zymoseptoria tritici ST99CH_3D7]|uniref:CBM1 domain-containing protein n=1 Tax=Zymoseptoria tritici (strain ST99CH_3D7) TaxID=1276538 RepID=A0A1X7RRD2_ZYMT9|nr:unnamed protein product [Zymoseptoria tritici ST99CH_3D7]
MQFFNSGHLLLVVALTTGVQALTRGVAYACNKHVNSNEPLPDPLPQNICGSSGSFWKWMPGTGGATAHDGWGCCVPYNKVWGYQEGCEKGWQGNPAVQDQSCWY